MQYADAQRYRLGTNFQLLPINRALPTVHTHQRDGLMAFISPGAHLLRRCLRQPLPTARHAIASPMASRGCRR